MKLLDLGGDLRHGDRLVDAIRTIASPLDRFASRISSIERLLPHDREPRPPLRVIRVEDQVLAESARWALSRIQ